MQHYEADCRFIRETDEAVLVEVEGEEQWIPLSQVTRMRKAPDGSGTITMTRWIAEQKGFL